jgi:hypothetical protein
MPSRNYFIEQAATLLKFAKQTSDPKVALKLLDKAASFSEQIDSPSLANLDTSLQAPDVQSEQ